MDVPSAAPATSLSNRVRPHRQSGWLSFVGGTAGLMRRRAGASCHAVVGQILPQRTLTEDRAAKGQAIGTRTTPLLPTGQETTAVHRHHSAGRPKAAFVTGMVLWAIQCTKNRPDLGLMFRGQIHGLPPYSGPPSIYLKYKKWEPPSPSQGEITTRKGGRSGMKSGSMGSGNGRNECGSGTGGDGASPCRWP